MRFKREVRGLGSMLAFRVVKRNTIDHHCTFFTLKTETREGSNNAATGTTISRMTDRHLSVTSPRNDDTDDRMSHFSGYTHTHTSPTTGMQPCCSLKTTLVCTYYTRAQMASSVIKRSCLHAGLCVCSI